MAKNTMQEEIKRSLDKVEKERNLKENNNNLQQNSNYNNLNNVNIENSINEKNNVIVSNLDRKLNQLSRKIKKEKKIYTTLYLKNSVNNKLNKIATKLNINKSDVIEILLNDFENNN
ncbi:hypothetical protein [Spiroplasma endosymbiont of Lariophagus distinguendus]|uniref:hypothetical protein n=1 Tax=Spiroplasma endosymbiont of Lariophagus distinguendus TaxID=2935082 RepID=UPI002079F6EA|nr:hypothetical protein [Spiroplasma endosymbiont of Lariophagus distinguendus]